jgi:hypothetical protein
MKLQSQGNESSSRVNDVLFVAVKLSDFCWFFGFFLAGMLVCQQLDSL